jgi:2-octaprenyl-6-methoxyphenol hydroxylase
MPSMPALLTHPDVTILGGGPVGLLSALCLAKHLPETTTIRLITGSRTPPSDGRAAAIIGQSMAVLADLGLAETFRQEGAPLAAIRMIDVTGRLVRAPTTTFRASDAGQDDFGVSLTTASIVRLLGEAIARTGRINVLPIDIESVTRDDSGFVLRDQKGRTHATSFLVAADGQRSLAREAAGIPVRRWSYPQVALTFVVTHERDHDDVSTEFHTADGPFTLVPSGPMTSTVVWMMREEDARRRMELDDVAFARDAERTCKSLLGKLVLSSPRGAYPMGGLLAERFADDGIALVGETGHAFPPIGAQGLNLGFRDADTLGRALGHAWRNRDGSEPINLAQWDRERRRDAGLRTAGVDAFNRSLLTDFLPAALIRGAGLSLLGNVPPLRRMAMRFGMAK